MQLVQLQNVAKVIQGGRHGLSGKHFVDKGYPAYGAGGLNGCLVDYEFDCEAIILSSIGARCGKCFYVKDKWVSLANTQVILPNPEKVIAKFLWYQLNDEGRWPRSGTGQPFIKPSDVKEHKFFLPPIQEQIRIVTLLDKVYNIRRLYHYTIELGNSYLQSVFMEMFGDPVTNPMGWEMHKLGKHIKFLTSGSRGWAQYYSSSGARFIRSLDVRMNYIENTNAVFVVPPKSQETERTKVEANDVLLTITGAQIGRVAPVPIDIGEAYISQHVSLLRLDDELNTEYVSRFLSLPRGGQYQIAKSQYGQTKPGLNLNQIKDFKIPFPPKSMRGQYIDVVQRYERLRSQQREALRQAEHLFQSLLHHEFKS